MSKERDETKKIVYLVWMCEIGLVFGPLGYISSAILLSKLLWKLHIMSYQVFSVIFDVLVCLSLFSAKF